MILNILKYCQPELPIYEEIMNIMYGWAKAEEGKSYQKKKTKASGW